MSVICIQNFETYVKETEFVWKTSIVVCEDYYRMPWVAMLIL
jgi:hypothetical protein